jgi:uncharacterized membrane protein
MNWNNLTTGTTGLMHLLASVAALVLGSIVLAMKKGTAIHKKIGYAYSMTMLVLLITAFMIYRLFDGWGIFHWSAVLSSVTLLGGLMPMITKRHTRSFVVTHFSLMYWSVMGLYGAAVAEVLVRIPKVVIESGVPNRVFYDMTGSLVLG